MAVVIFKPVLTLLVLQGRKTETRRPVHEGQTLARYHAGKDYAVQPGRGKSQIARIWVTEVEQQRLGEITNEAAYLEGFADRDAFIDYWRGLYDGQFDPEQRVWVIRFHLYAMPCARCGKMTTQRWSIDMDVPALWACDAVCVHLLTNGVD